MKRFVLLFFVLSPLCALNASWSPSLAVMAGYHGTSVNHSVDTSEKFRSSGKVTAEADIPAFTFSSHRISFPVSISFISQTEEDGRMLVPGRYEGALSVRYGYRISPLYSLSLSFDCRLSWFEYLRASYWRPGATATFALHPLPHFAVIFPISVSAGRAETSFNAGIGIQTAFGGWK